MKYEMGIELKDIVTGFTGYVVGRTEYLTGCNHYGLQSKKLDEKGNPASWQWIDESRLIPTGKSIKGYKCPKTSGLEQNAPSM